jgi:capsular exopolysaccharide synthesis family protein
MNTGQTDPRTYAKVFWRWKLLFLVFLIGAPGVAYAIVSRQTKVYQSSLLLQEDSLAVDTSLFTSGAAPAPSSGTNSETLSGEARVIETTAVARLAARHLKPAPQYARSLLANITSTADTDTGFITIVAKAPDPQRAADIANAFGAAVVALRTQQAIGLLTTTIDQVVAQLGQLSRADIVGHTQLSGELQRLRALRAAQNSNAQILQAAVPNPSPVSPRVARVVALGLLGGLLLGIGAVFLAEAADRRLRHPEDLEELTGLPLLAVIPRVAFSAKAAAGRGDEAFHMLRSALMFFNVERPLSTVLIASPVKGDGKTTVATRLSVALALGGRKVILVDADLRRPQAASRLGVTGESISSGRGLTGLLTGQTSLIDTLVQIPLETDEAEFPAHLKGKLSLLPAGTPPPNPSELLASHRMRELLHGLSGLADIVIIDTNPLLSVSDSLPLLDSVSGVILVARLNHTTKDAVRRIQKTISNTSGTVLGVVATDAAGGLYGRYGYGSGYGYYGYTSNAYANGNGKRGVMSRIRRSRKAKHTKVS